MLQPQLRTPSDDGSFQGEIDERLQQHSSNPPESEPLPNDMDKVVELSKPDETTTGERDAQNLRRESAARLPREFFVEGGIREHGQRSGERRGVYSSGGFCTG